VEARSRADDGAVPARRRTRVLLLCCTAQFLGVLDVTIVTVALPPIRDDLAFSTPGLQWVVNAYTLACAACLLPGGRAADLFGRREVFAGGLALFGIASLAGGLAQDQATLVAARAAQGIGGAVMAPTSLSILATVYDAGPARNRAFGLWGTMGALGGAAGALVGGLLTAWLSWRWTLLVTAPPALSMAIAALRTVPAGRPTRAPHQPLRLLRSRGLSGATAAVFCLGAAAVPMWFFLTLKLQRSLGSSALDAGLTFMPMSLAIAGCTQLAGRLAGPVGAGRVLAGGMTLLGAGLLMLSDADGELGVRLAALVCACGIGCSFVSTTITATSAVARTDAGFASGLVNTAFQVGGSIGLALLATTAGPDAALALAGAAALAGAVVAIGLLARRTSGPAAPA
jgi:predicted MFS family arabinose efflux permease